MDTLKLIAVAATLPWLAWLMVKPRVLTGLVIGLSLVQLNWFTRYLGAPPIFNRVSLALAGLLGVRILADMMISKRNRIRQWVILYPVLVLTVLFLCLTISTNVYNGESLLLGFYELRYYFFGFATCFGLYFYCEDILSIAFFKQAMIWIGLVQLPFAVLKWFAAAGGQARTLDSVSGTFAGYGELVGCQIFVISLVLFEELFHEKPVLKINNYLLCLLLLIPMLLSKSRTFTIYLALTILFSWLFSSYRKNNLAIAIKKIAPITVVVVLSMTAFYFFFWKTNYDLSQQFSVDYVWNYYMRPPVVDHTLYMAGADTSMGRFRAVVEAVRLIAEKPVNMLIGYGSGASAEASFLGIAGNFYQKYGPYAGIGRNQYSKTLVEFGAAGVTLFVSFFFMVYIRLYKLFPNRSELNDVFALLLFSLTLLSVYVETLTTFFFSFTLAFFLASVQVEYDKNSRIRHFE